jgi:DNA-binding MurR/RpiR family transcriptional regulator
MMMEAINNLIRTHYKTLSNGQKLVAEYIINHPRHVALSTAKEVGELTNTSETTVIRFCYKVGYKGYSQLQKEVQKSLLEDEVKDPIVKYREDTDALSREGNLLAIVMEQDIKHIEETLGSINKDKYQNAVNTLVKAKKRFVIGLRSSHAPASWLAFSLNIVRGETYLYRGNMDDSNYLLSELNEESVVVAITFPRYVQETISFVRAAKKRGATILVITDHELAPISEYADLLFTVKAPKPIGLSGMPTIFSLLNVLVTGVASSGEKEVQEHFLKYENARQDFSQDV